MEISVAFDHDVNGCPTDDSLAEVVKTRDGLNDTVLQRNANGYLVGRDLIPEIPSDSCECKVLTTTTMKKENAGVS